MVSFGSFNIGEKWQQAGTISHCLGYCDLGEGFCFSLGLHTPRGPLRDDQRGPIVYVRGRERACPPTLGYVFLGNSGTDDSLLCVFCTASNEKDSCR